jgi:hypothetical protein
LVASVLVLPSLLVLWDHWDRRGRPSAPAAASSHQPDPIPVAHSTHNR